MAGSGENGVMAAAARIWRENGNDAKWRKLPMAKIGGHRALSERRKMNMAYQ
jgi:hypothetical protein